MKVADILAQIRTRFLADTGDPPLWSDDVLLAHYNEARREAANRALLFNDVDTALDPITITDANAVYPLDQRIIKVRSISLSSPEGLMTTLQPMTVNSLRQTFGEAWQSDTGKPVAYWPNQYIIRVYPIPSAEWAGQTLTVDGFRLPLADVALVDTESEFSQIEIAALMYWVCHLAYLFEDSDVQNKVNRSELYASKFAEKFGLPVRVSQRLHDLRSTGGFQSTGLAVPTFGRGTSRSITAL